MVDEVPFMAPAGTAATDVVVAWVVVAAAGGIYGAGGGGGEGINALQS